MSKLTKKLALQLNIEMWDELAENGGDVKSGIYHKICSRQGLAEGWESCFACDYKKERPCYKFCILHKLWPETHPSCMSGKSIYQKWYMAKTKKTRQKYAKQISDGAKLILEAM